MHCVNCGNEIKEGQKYCGKCGTKVSNNNNLDYRYTFIYYSSNNI